MKICIIGHTEKNYLPYIEKYTSFFDQNNISYDVIYWQREAKEMPENPNEFNFFEEGKDGFFNKLSAYGRYKKFVLDILEKNHYDKVVVLTTLPAFVLRKYLKKNFKDRYLFDFRDYSFEKYPFYKRAVDKIIDNSEITTISSQGFMEFLNKNRKIIMNHNIPNTVEIEKAPDLKEKSVISVGFIGGVRYFEENVALINKLKNTFRYQLWYIGKQTNACDLKGYCEGQDVKNISFIGKYQNSEKAELYKSVDIINSIYGDDSLEVTTALPNRLYEACLYKKPIISSKNTYLGELIEQYDLGFIVDVQQDDVLTMLNDYVDNFDSEKFTENCRRFLSAVEADEAHLSEHLGKFIKN